MFSKSIQFIDKIYKVSKERILIERGPLMRRVSKKTAPSIPSYTR